MKNDIVAALALKESICTIACCGTTTIYSTADSIRICEALSKDGTSSRVLYRTMDGDYFFVDVDLDGEIIPVSEKDAEEFMEEYI